MLKACKTGNQPDCMLLPFATNVATIKFNSKKQVLFRTNRGFDFVTTWRLDLNIIDTYGYYMKYFLFTIVCIEINLKILFLFKKS